MSILDPERIYDVLSNLDIQIPEHLTDNPYAYHKWIQKNRHYIDSLHYITLKQYWVDNTLHNTLTLWKSTNRRLVQVTRTNNSTAVLYHLDYIPKISKTRRRLINQLIFLKTKTI